MKKFYLIILLILSSCSLEKNDNYYRNHPQQLQKALTNCNTSDSKNCQKLYFLAQQMNNLAGELQVDPQGFGSQILALQQKLANENSYKDNQDLEVDRVALEQRIAIVKWLLAPES